MISDSQIQQLRNDGMDSVADEIEMLRTGVRLAIVANETGGMMDFEIASLKKMIDVPNDPIKRRGGRSQTKHTKHNPRPLEWAG